MSKAAVKEESTYISDNAQHKPFQNQISDHTFNPCVEKDRKLCKAKAKKDNRPTTKTHRKPRKSHVQIHLKKVEGDFKNESVEYSVQFPHRVALRLEYLMNSTKVQLNDRQYMDTLYSKLLDEEAHNLTKISEMRQAAEQDRVKQLVIQGLMPPPPDMLYLYDHPVFRVNKMLRRLAKNSKDLASDDKIKEIISPVEPFEFDGNEFFKHLHKTGTYWLPEVERIAQEEKMAGKIARAKLRLLEKKKEEEYKENMLKLLYTSDMEESKDDQMSKANEDDNGSGAKERRKLRKLSNLREQLRLEAEKRAARLQIRRNILERREQARRKRALERQKQRDMVFLEEREKQRVKLIQKHSLWMESKNLDNLDRIAASNDALYSNVKVDPSKKKYFKQPPTPPNVVETESFKRIRKAFRVGGSNSLSKYGPAENHVMKRYLDAIKDADELFHNGEEVTMLYSREQQKADDFMNKLNRILEY